MDKRNISVILFISIIFSVIFSGCSMLNSPPEIIDVQQEFNHNYADLQIVVDFLINQDFESIHITKANGTMWADFADNEIQNNEVNNAIQRLIGEGNYISIYKDGYTIEFLQWRSFRDMGCGIAYTINGFSKPDINFMTQCTPLYMDNWYYYVSDYNTWRERWGGKADSSVIPREQGGGSVVPG